VLDKRPETGSAEAAWFVLTARIMRTISQQLSCTHTNLTPSDLDEVVGGEGPGPADFGSALGTGIEGSFKALNQSDAPGWAGVNNAINTVNQYNPFAWAVNGARNYFTDRTGGSYTPATANPDGSVNQGFMTYE
jgi:hypothetical protein